MSAKWDDFIQEGAFKGTKFDFVSARETHENVLDVREFPARNGAFVEFRARKPIRMEIMAIFIEDDYPEKMWELSDKLSDGTPGELVHPIHGTIQAACERFVVSHDIEDAADAATIQITLVEHTKATQLVFENRPTIAAKANETRTEAAAVTVNADAQTTAVLDSIVETASMAVALTSPEYIEAVAAGALCIAAATTASTLADTFEADGDTLTAVAIQAATNQALTEIDASVQALADYETQEAYDLSRSLLLTAAHLGELATLLVSTKPPLSAFVVEADIGLLAWVHAIYGDSARVDEVMTLNSFEDPLLLKAGTTVRAYAF